jgi:hypothetical protein
LHKLNLNAHVGLGCIEELRMALPENARRIAMPSSFATIARLHATRDAVFDMAIHFWHCARISFHPADSNANNGKDVAFVNANAVSPHLRPQQLARGATSLGQTNLSARATPLVIKYSLSLQLAKFC